MRTATLDDYKQRILRVMLHVQDHLDDPLGLEQLAAVAAFSPYHFHRVFRGMVGESLDGYVRRLRLERAAVTLKTTKRSVLDVALGAGYASHEAFTRAFRARFRCAPSDFRKSGISFDRDPSPFEPRCAEGGPLEVQIDELEPARVAFSRHLGPYDGCGATWERLLTWAGSEGLVGHGTRFLGVCYDDPEVTPSERVRYDACVTIDRDVEPAGEFGVQTIAGGPYARTTHIGPYDRFEPTYLRLIGEWAPRSGHALRPLPCLEVYLNSPENTDPEDLVTDIFLPLSP